MGINKRQTTIGTKSGTNRVDSKLSTNASKLSASASRLSANLESDVARQVEPNAVAIKVVVVRHEHGYIAYPLEGQIVGAVVGQGNTYEEAYNDVVSALNAHVEMFGSEVLEADFPILEAYVAEHLVPVKPGQNAEIPS